MKRRQREKGDKEVRVKTELGREGKEMRGRGRGGGRGEREREGHYVDRCGGLSDQRETRVSIGEAGDAPPEREGKKRTPALDTGII